jgi:hypothetical protein
MNVLFHKKVHVKRTGIQTSPPQTSYGLDDASPLGFLGEWQKQFSQNFHLGSLGRVFLEKIFQRVAYENIKLKDGIDMEVYGNLEFVNYDWHIPGDPTTLENSPKGLLKSLLVGTRDI